MERKFNNIYRRLVEDESDIEGHIAYSLYKTDKECFIEDFKSRNNGQIPKEDDLLPFHSVSCLEPALDRYRLMANVILKDFLNQVLQQSITEIEETTSNNHKQLLEEIIMPIAPPSKWKQFWDGTKQSIAGAFIFALILAGVGFISFFKTGDINITFKPEQKQEADVKPNSTGQHEILPVLTTDSIP